MKRESLIAVVSCKSTVKDRSIREVRTLAI